MFHKSISYMQFYVLAITFCLTNIHKGTIKLYLVVTFNINKNVSNLRPLESTVVQVPIATITSA